MKIIPEQKTGQEKNILESATAETDEAAKALFLKAKERLLNINNWSEYAGAASAKFTLTDAEGAPLDTKPEKDNLFKIEIPAPGNKSGEGFDWVRIEAVEEMEDEQNNYEFVAIKVRPCSSPLNDLPQVAHFFSEESTSSFVVQRKNQEVIAAVFGRNEKPNPQSEGVMNYIRNALVAVGAITGVANIQWKSLVKGLLA